MEREHLIIIALVLVALYMINNDTNTDSVKAIGPMGRIRYDTDLPTGLSNQDGPLQEPFVPMMDDFYSDKSFAHSQHIKNHIRHGNRNNVFSGMMGADGQQDNVGTGSY